jgi:hypothetical protein
MQGLDYRTKRLGNFFSQGMRNPLAIYKNTLPHRQFVFTLPKLLRPYFKHDRNLFEEVSRIISSIKPKYYTESAATAVKTGIVISYQSFGDLMRWNPHCHCDRQDVGNADRAMRPSGAKKYPGVRSAHPYFQKL